MEVDLKGKVALVTGGSKGIGYGIASAMVQKGMKVAITGRNSNTVKEAAQSLSKLGREKVLGIEADVKNLESQQSAVSQIIEKWGQLDVLIANAGVGFFAPIDEMTTEQWNQTIDTNLTGVFFSVKACVEELKKTEGYIITISSLAGTNFFPAGSAYSASKFGLTGFSQSIMLDLRHYGIKVSTIMPGSVTSHFNNHDPSPKDAWKIQPEDLGKLTIDLLEMNPRTLPSKIEVRPSIPPKK